MIWKSARVAEYLGGGLQLTYAGANPAPGTKKAARSVIGKLNVWAITCQGKSLWLVF